jgi:hypothetical protein
MSLEFHGEISAKMTLVRTDLKQGLDALHGTQTRLVETKLGEVVARGDKG